MLGLVPGILRRRRLRCADLLCRACDAFGSTCAAALFFAAFAHAGRQLRTLATLGYDFCGGPCPSAVCVPQLQPFSLPDFCTRMRGIALLYCWLPAASISIRWFRPPLPYTLRFCCRHSELTFLLHYALYPTSDNLFALYWISSRGSARGGSLIFCTLTFAFTLDGTTCAVLLDFYALPRAAQRAMQRFPGSSFIPCLPGLCRSPLVLHLPCHRTRWTRYQRHCATGEPRHAAVPPFCLYFLAFVRAWCGSWLSGALKARGMLVCTRRAAEGSRKGANTPFLLPTLAAQVLGVHMTLSFLSAAPPGRILRTLPRCFLPRCAFCPTISCSVPGRSLSERACTTFSTLSILHSNFLKNKVWFLCANADTRLLT